MSKHSLSLLQLSSEKEIQNEKHPFASETNAKWSSFIYEGYSIAEDKQ